MASLEKKRRSAMKYLIDRNIYLNNLPYVNANNTDIRKTFKKIKEELKLK